MPRSNGARTGEGPGKAAPSTNYTDEFLMYSYKVTLCNRKYPHDWASCPCGHKGERAARRDLRTSPYVAIACTFAKQKLPCPNGDACPFAHSLFEYCVEELRVLPGNLPPAELCWSTGALTRAQQGAAPASSTAQSAASTPPAPALLWPCSTSPPACGGMVSSHGGTAPLVHPPRASCSASASGVGSCSSSAVSSPVKGPCGAQGFGVPLFGSAPGDATLLGAPSALPSLLAHREAAGLDQAVQPQDALSCSAGRAGDWQPWGGSAQLFDTNPVDSCSSGSPKCLDLSQPLSPQHEGAGVPCSSSLLAEASSALQLPALMQSLMGAGSACEFGAPRSAHLSPMDLTGLLAVHTSEPLPALFGAMGEGSTVGATLSAPAGCGAPAVALPLSKQNKKKVCMGAARGSGAGRLGGAVLGPATCTVSPESNDAAGARKAQAAQQLAQMLTNMDEGVVSSLVNLLQAVQLQQQAAA